MAKCWRCHLLFLLAIALFSLTSCTPVPAGTTAPTPGTVIAGTAVAATASVGTAQPVIITPLPPDYTPPPTVIPPTQTPIPPLPGGLGPTELKYRVLAEFPDFFFCDPDYYPIGRGDEAAVAIQRFPELQANGEEFNTILAHNGLSGVSTFTDDQKLLIYRQHKKLAALRFEQSGDVYRFQIQQAKTEGQGELITGTIDGQGSIKVLEKKSSIATCPICLAAGTLIDTPGGPIPVEDVQVGAWVWTVDQAGVRVAQPVEKVGKTVVPATHQVIHLVLDDGRTLSVSPGHPTTDGRRIGKLHPGEALDGGWIVSMDWVTYTGYATYDLLPAGKTGFYWADGILIASTLKENDP